jgi:hypothetical protein
VGKAHGRRRIMELNPERVEGLYEALIEYGSGMD